MARRSLIGAVAWLAVIGVVCSAASGASFSRPVQLPGLLEGWNFVMAPDGEAVAVRASEHGAIVYPLGSSTTLGPPVRVTVVGDYGLSLSHGVLDDRQRLALAFTYFDHTEEPSGEPHGGEGCCDRVAIASWRLGEPVPTAQTLTPKLDGVAHAYQEPSRPEIVLGPTSLTALWTLGASEFEESYEGGGPVRLQEAFGPFGGPYDTQTLMSAPGGIWDYALTTASDGRPLASWVDDGNELRTVAGLRTGALHHSHRVQPLPGLANESSVAKESSFGFTTNNRGETLFAFQTSRRDGKSRLLMVTSRDASPFSRPRLIHTIPPEIPTGKVLLGPQGTLLASWDHWTRESRNGIQEDVSRFAVGGLSGPFGPSIRVPAFPGEPVGFVGGKSEAVVIFRHYEKRGFLLDAILAYRGHPFGKPHLLDPGLFNCGIQYGGDSLLEPIESGPDGNAILLITCEDKRQYMIRYTP
jgi:hypothetical protein